MRHQTERDRLIHEGVHERHQAHVDGDIDAYNRAHEKHAAALGMAAVYQCFCGKEWDGEGRLVIAYTALYELGDPHLIYHGQYEPIDAHNLVLCPECKVKFLAYHNR